MTETVCECCNYRFSFNPGNETAWCPICGQTYWTKDLVPINGYLGEDQP